MALFSRRPKKPAEQPSTSPEPAQGEDVAAEIAPDGAAAPSAAAEAPATDAPVSETDAAASTAESGTAPDAPADEAATDAAAGPTRPEAPLDAPAASGEAVGTVSISVSSFGGLGVSPAASP